MAEDAMTLAEHVAKQVAAYDEIRPIYEVFAKALGEVLSRAIKDLGLMAIVQSRAKDKASFAEKSVRKRNIYPDAINQLTDLCGGRVIVDCKDDIEKVCQFIQKHFEISEMEDVFERLGTAEFGYRSVHFIVSLKRGEFEDVLKSIVKKQSGPDEEQRFQACMDRLYERRTSEEYIKTGLPLGPIFKAEIQVRTLLQHAWAAIGHDRIYKSEFNVPVRWQREAIRVAAYLEEADEAFSRTVKGVEGYRNYYGAYMSRKQQEKELEKLEAVLKYDANNMRLAHRIARLAQSLQNLNLAEERLKPFVERWEHSTEGISFKKNSKILHSSQDPNEMEHARTVIERLQDTGMASVLLEFGQTIWEKTKSAGREYLEWSINLNLANVDACVALAETYLDEKDRDTALKWFEQAFRTSPEEPCALAGFLFCKLAVDRDLGFLPLTRPSLEAAIKRCREQASVKVYLPWAYYDIGFFELLLGRPHESLTAYAKAVCLSESEDTILKPLEWIEYLHKILGDRLPELDWTRRLLIAGRVGKLLHSTRANAHTECDRYLASVQSRNVPSFETPVIIVAGGTHPSVEQKMKEYQLLLETAFKDFRGMVLSGGTMAGISAIVGDLPDSTHGPIRKVSCIPNAIPASTKVHPGYEIYYSTGMKFSPLEPIQTWIDLMASNIDPADVRLLGINGGGITAFEFRLALMLGATVGVLRDSGRAASALIDDEDWKDAPGLLLLPTDTQTVKNFVQGNPTAEVLDQTHREALAKEAHEKYRVEQKKRHVGMDPAMADWEELPPDLRNSNFNQIDHIEEKLRIIGMKLCKTPPEKVQFDKFSEEQIEKMAESEHGRWNVERLRSGWSLGERGVEAKKSPYLVSWAELPDEVKEWDRQPIAALPEMLKKLGYEIVRE